MKIFFAIKALENSSGGSERVFTEVCNQLHIEKKSISVLTFDKPEYKAFYPLKDDIKKISLNHGDIFRHATIFSFLKSILLLRKILIKEKPDVVVAFMHSMYVPIALASVFLNIKVIASEHATFEYYEKKRIERGLIKIISPLLFKIVFLSDSVAKRYPKSLRENAIVISNPVKMDFDENKIQSCEKQDVILSVGSLNDNKRHLLLINAFLKIAEKHDKWKLIIIGDGELRNDLNNLIHEKSMKDRIILKGVVKDVESYYSTSKIFVLASKQESFGLSVAEAMFFECASICFSSSYGAQELLLNNNGVLLDESLGNEVDDLSEALDKLIRNHELCIEYGKKAKRFIVKNYEIKNIARKWIDLLSLDT